METPYYNICSMESILHGDSVCLRAAFPHIVDKYKRGQHRKDGTRGRGNKRTY